MVNRSIWVIPLIKDHCVPVYRWSVFKFSNLHVVNWSYLTVDSFIIVFIMTKTDWNTDVMMTKTKVMMKGSGHHYFDRVISENLYSVFRRSY